MKRVLVLYPGLVAERHAILAAHRWRLRLGGVRLVLADDTLGPHDADAFAEVVKLPPPEEVGASVDALRRYVASHRIDAIVAQSEPSLLVGARIAQELGLRGPSVAAALATTNKLESRRRLASAGIPQPRFALVRSTAEVRDFARGDGGGWPVVLKAIASSRQRLVTKVDRASDVDAAVARMQRSIPEAKDVRRLAAFARLFGHDLECDPERDFLVESFAGGRSLECDGVVVGRSVRSMGVCEQLMSAAHPFFIEGYLLPARLESRAAAELEQFTETALRALGLSNTGYSTEYRLGPDGPRLIEVNGRLGWDEGLSDLFRAVCGSMPAVVALRVALGRRVGRLDPRGHGALLYRNNYEKGTVELVPTRTELEALRGRALQCDVFVRPGEPVRAAVDPDSRPHLAQVLAYSRRSTESARELASRALERLAVTVTPSRVPRSSAKSSSRGVRSGRTAVRSITADGSAR